MKVGLKAMDLQEGGLMDWWLHGRMSLRVVDLNNLPGFPSWLSLIRLPGSDQERNQHNIDHTHANWYKNKGVSTTYTQ